MTRWWRSWRVRVAEEEAVGAQVGGQSMNIATRTGRVAVALPPSGIITTPTYWCDEFEGEWLMVFAGSAEDEPARGAFAVSDHAEDRNVVQLAPEAVGALTCCDRMAKSSWSAPSRDGSPG